MHYTVLYLQRTLISVFKASAKTFVPFTNLKGIWCLQKSDVLHRSCLPAAIENSKEPIWDHRFFFKTKNANKASILFFKSYMLYVHFFLKFSKARWDEKSHVVELRFVLLLFHEHYIVWKKSYLLVVHGLVGHIKSISLARLPRTGRLIFIIYK